jgi:transcriptional regulator with XRE-family HTH domain
MGIISIGVSMPPIGQLIRKAREKAGLTQAELAERLGLPIPRVSEMENDKRKDVLLSTIRDYAKALKVPLWKLLKQLDED